MNSFKPVHRNIMEHGRHIRPEDWIWRRGICTISNCKFQDVSENPEVSHLQSNCKNLFHLSNHVYLLPCVLHGSFQKRNEKGWKGKLNGNKNHCSILYHLSIYLLFSKNGVLFLFFVEAKTRTRDLPKDELQPFKEAIEIWLCRDEKDQEKPRQPCQPRLQGPTSFLGQHALKRGKKCEIGLKKAAPREMERLEKPWQSNKRIPKKYKLLGHHEG